MDEILGGLKRTSNNGEKIEIKTPVMRRPILTDDKIKTIWNGLGRVIRQLSGNRSKDFKREILPIRKEFEIYLKARGLIE